jgi:hypothetical protein
MPNRRQNSQEEKFPSSHLTEIVASNDRPHISAIVQKVGYFDGVVG